MLTWLTLNIFSIYLCCFVFACFAFDFFGLTSRLPSFLDYISLLWGWWFNWCGCRGFSLFITASRGFNSRGFNSWGFFRWWGLPGLLTFTFAGWSPLPLPVLVFVFPFDLPLSMPFSTSLVFPFPPFTAVAFPLSLAPMTATRSKSGGLRLTLRQHLHFLESIV